MAGLNFSAAREDLSGRDDLGYDMFIRLNIAFQQEMRHAQQVKTMLKLLGYSDREELTKIRVWLMSVLERSMAPFPHEQHAYVRILLNHVIEEKLARVGNDETLRSILVIEGVAGLHDAARLFHQTVAREEPEHVALDAELITRYQGFYPDLTAEAALRAMRSRGTPFYRAIRVKREFVRAASAYASACEPAYAPAHH